jgi:DNA replication protein DnaC
VSIKPSAVPTAGQIEYYCRAMKAPRIREAAARLADQARDGGWTHEEYLAAVVSREVAAKEASGAEARARGARFPARKSLEDFSFAGCLQRRDRPLNSISCLVTSYRCAGGGPDG